MRIIAKKKDYYDCIMQYGMDRELIYVREPREVSKEHTQWPFVVNGEIIHPPTSIGGKSVDFFVVGFCGKIYPVIRFSEYDASVTGENPYHHTYCFNQNDVDAYLATVLKKKDLSFYVDKDRRRWRAGPFWRWDSLRQLEVEKFFERCARLQDAFAEMFIKEKAPIFIATMSGSQYTITYNAMLRDVEFFRVFDPHQAYQTLRMWMSNQAVPMRPIPHVSDADLIVGKGFDLKESFRKPPSKKKKR